jgi:hypothetical protein
MIALLPALLLLLMQGAAPAEALDPRLRAELWMTIHRSGLADGFAAALPGRASPSAPILARAEPKEAPGSLRRVVLTWDSALILAPIIDGDRSRDGPRA